MAAANDDHKLQADSLYERYGKPLEKSYRGQYVTISADGQTVLAPSVLEVAEKALETLGPGSFVFKVGEKAVWRWRNAYFAAWRCFASPVKRLSPRGDDCRDRLSA
jgi:hypothetical protein